MSRLQPGVAIGEMSYSRIARPQLGHAGVLATGCSDELNKLNWGMAHFLQIPSNGTCSLIGLPGLREQLAGVHVRFAPIADIGSNSGH
jgi:hypothetical protein